MIRNILFDMGQVLIEWDPAKQLQRKGASPDCIKALMKELFHETEWIALDGGFISEQEACDAVSQRVDEAYRPFVHFMVFDWWKEEFIYKPGMETLIRNLKQRGCRIYLLSNANLRQAEYCHRLPAWDCFSGRITSADIQLLKPDPSFYRYALEHLGLQAGECIFIDDSPMNILFAKQEGIHGIVYHDDTAQLARQLDQLL